MTEASAPQFDYQKARAEDNEIDLGYLLAIFIDNKWLIVTTTVLISFIGVAYSLLAAPEYRADALLQIESEERNLGALESVMLGQEPVQSNTQSEILRSRMIMRRAAAQAGLDLVVEPNTFPLAGDLFLRRGVGRPDFFEESPYVWSGESITVESLHIAEDILNEKLILRVEEGQGFSLFTEEEEFLAAGQARHRLVLQNPYLEILVSEIAAPEGAEFTVIKRSEQAMTGNLQSRFDVRERGRDTGILEISLTGSDPEEIRRSLDAIANIYLVQNINRQAAEAENRLSFLEEQTPEVRATLTGAENLLNEYRASRESVDLSFETQSMLQRLVEVEARLNELTLQEEEVSRRFTPSHPSYQTLLEQRAQLQSERQRLELRVNNLPETQRQVLRLNRDVEVTQEIYTQMLNTMQELRIARAGTVGNVRILDEALVASEPIAPRRAVIAAVSSIVGLMMGLMLVLLRHMMRRGVEAVDQIEAIGLQVYATIPMSPGQSRLDQALKVVKGLEGKKSVKAFFAKSRSNSSQEQDKLRRQKTKKVEQKGGGILAFVEPADLSIEAIRSLRTSLHFVMLESKNNIVMLTGPSPGVGKSFVSVNLATVCAHAGTRVLLIDSDMRKGHVHKIFGVANKGGLSDILANKIEHTEAIRHSINERMDYIVRGAVPPNPSELLTSELFTNLLKKVSKLYDLVIIDTPPVLAVTDAAVVGRRVGTTLLVTRFQSTYVKEIERSLALLNSSGVVVQGAILNAVKKTATSYYGYGHYHYEYQSGD